MRIPFLSMTSPFEGLLEHAEKVKECGWAFQQAIECHAAEQCKLFDQYRQEVSRLENEADAIKRRIRGHLPRGTRMPVHQFQLFMYLKEQDNVLDSVEDALDWLSYRRTAGINKKEIKEALFALLDAVIEPTEELSRMVAEAKKYFDSYSEKQRETDPVAIYHLVKLAEIIGSVADHAENAGDMMRAMIARKEKSFWGK